VVSWLEISPLRWISGMTEVQTVITIVNYMYICTYPIVILIIQGRVLFPEQKNLPWYVNAIREIGGPSRETIRIDHLSNISLKTHQLSREIMSQMLQRYEREKYHISTQNFKTLRYMKSCILYIQWSLANWCECPEH
jgi:hypothetical protein